MNDRHHGWVCAIVVTGAEWLKQHVPEADTFRDVGSSEFVSFGASDAKLGTLVKVDGGIMMMFKNLT